MVATFCFYGACAELLCQNGPRGCTLREVPFTGCSDRACDRRGLLVAGLVRRTAWFGEPAGRRAVSRNLEVCATTCVEATCGGAECRGSEEGLVEEERGGGSSGAGVIVAAGGVHVLRVWGPGRG